MKLAEGLALRSDAQKRLAQAPARAVACARCQKGGNLEVAADPQRAAVFARLPRPPQEPAATRSSSMSNRVCSNVDPAARTLPSDWARPAAAEAPSECEVSEIPPAAKPLSNAPEDVHRARATLRWPPSDAVPTPTIDPSDSVTSALADADPASPTSVSTLPFLPNVVSA